VYIEVIDPAAFGGREAFTRQTEYLAQACRRSSPRPGVDHVRVPGEKAMAHKRHVQVHGVTLYPGVLDALRPFAEQFGVDMPQGLSEAMS
jgi:LDH2 family malate/lactate/ureidoglycolate dehydrogenase